MTYHIIYKTTNIINGNYYYGIHSTENLKDDYFGSGSKLQNAIKKYGIENFKKEIICYFDSREEALIYESKIVNEELVNDPMCYNLTIGGGAPPSQKGKVSVTNKLKGEERTEKQKEASKRHSETMRGRLVWNKGKRGVQTGWNKGTKYESGKKQAKIKYICPHCEKEGFGNLMKRWHFDNCKMRK